MTHAVGRSYPGRQREANEDTFLADADLRLFVVADGMGGRRAGAVASCLVVDTIAEFVRSSREDSRITWPYGLDRGLSFEANQLKNAIQYANQRVYYEGKRRPECAGMGSTVVAAMIADHRLVHSNVGDSRLYLQRGGVLEQLSKDDSWSSVMTRAGADPDAMRALPMQHVLTSALGVGDQLELEISTDTLRQGDLLLLCTDGLHGPLGDQVIGQILAERSQPLSARADRLIQAADDAGGPDNVTVVLVELGGDE